MSAAGGIGWWGHRGLGPSRHTHTYTIQVKKEEEKITFSYKRHIIFPVLDFKHTAQAKLNRILSREIIAFEISLCFD